MGVIVLHGMMFSLGGLPDFTYSGEYETQKEKEGWRIRFLTSGTLKFKKPQEIDIFLIGGGDYTTTTRKTAANTDAEYSVEIGADGETRFLGDTSSGNSIFCYCR